MPVATQQKWSLHIESAESNRLLWALIISMLFHLVIFGGYYTGQKYNLWANLRWPAWLTPVKKLVELAKAKPPPLVQPQAQEDQIPLMFVDVSAAQATPAPPKKAKYYSNKNSLAANPEPDPKSDVPKITGTQQEMVKTEDVPREKFVPLQPAHPQPAAPPKPQEELVPKTTIKPGDLTVAKPDLTPKKGEGQATEDRPRTIREALARLQEHRLPGEKMKEEGGVSRHLEISSLDTEATPLGDYDSALVEAISQCWYSLLDAQQYASDYRGKVVLRFHLHADGRITDVTVTQNTAGTVPGLICETAIDKPSPYPPFPNDVRRVVGESRSIQFTFYYN